MSQAKDVLCLCIESNFITAILGDKNPQGAVFFKNIVSEMYQGYKEGALIDIQGTVSTIKKCLVEFGNNKLPKFCYVGVPSEFLKVKVMEAPIKFGRQITIQQRDVDNCFRINNPFVDDTHYTLIEQSPISYKIDDKKIIVEVVGAKASTLTCRLSYIAAKDSFLKLIKKTLNECGIPNVVFLPVVYSEGMYMFTTAERDSTVLYCNMDYNSTFVSVIRGDGVRFLKCFSLGADAFIGDIMVGKNLKPNVAEELYNKLDLTTMSSSEKYIVNSGGVATSFALVDINTIIIERIDEFAYYIDLCMSKSNMNFPDDMTLMLTGKGIAEIRGGAECLAKSLNRPVEVVCYNNLSKTGTSQNSTVFSLLSYAADIASDKNETKRRLY